MSSCFRKGDERVWMSNGSAELHLEEWRAALSRSGARTTPEGRALEASFTRRLESGLYDVDFADAELEGESVRRLLSRLVRELAQDVVSAAAGAAPRASLEFLAGHETRWRAAWVSWERVLVGWLADAPLSIPEPLDTASRAFELSARARYASREGTRAEEAALRREVCDLLSQVTDFVGPDLVRDELLTLADIEEALGNLRLAALRTRAAAELCRDPEERRLALEIAAAREAHALEG